MLILSLAFVTAASFATAEPVPAKPVAAQTDTMQFDVTEKYRFNLGGESGQYTNAERDDLAYFDGLSTTIGIEAVKGKPSDKWASIARINLFGAGDEKTRKAVSIILTVDRETHRISPEFSRGKDTPRIVFQTSLSMDKPIELRVVPSTPGKWMLVFGTDMYEVDCDLDVKAFSIIGSGVDVRFDPFVLMKKKSAS